MRLNLWNILWYAFLKEQNLLQIGDHLLRLTIDTLGEVAGSAWYIRNRPIVFGTQGRRQRPLFFKRLGYPICIYLNIIRERKIVWIQSRTIPNGYWEEFIKRIKEMSV